MRERYQIDVTRPTGCSVAMMKKYIYDAVRNWSGQFEPEHPLFDAFDPPHTPKVTRARVRAGGS